MPEVLHICPARNASLLIAVLYCDSLQELTVRWDEFADDIECDEPVDAEVMTAVRAAKCDGATVPQLARERLEACEREWASESGGGW